MINTSIIIFILSIFAMVSLFVLYIVKNTIKKCPIGDNNLECSGHGKCQDNSCVCDHKYFGDKCDTVVECTSPNDCNAGKVCIKNKCQYQCNENKDCNINKEKCVNNRCQSVICKIDQDCGKNQKCNNIGLCECMSAFKNCPKGCVDIKTDPNNCGDCDKVIPQNSTCQDGNIVCDKYYTGTNCEIPPVNKCLVSSEWDTLCFIIYVIGLNIRWVYQHYYMETFKIIQNKIKESGYTPKDLFGNSNDEKIKKFNTDLISLANASENSTGTSIQSLKDWGPVDENKMFVIINYLSLLTIDIRTNIDQKLFDCINCMYSGLANYTSPDNLMRSKDYKMVTCIQKFLNPKFVA
jgi:hypothetical protein